MCQCCSTLRVCGGFDARDFLSDQTFGDLGHDLPHQIASRIRRQTLEDAARHFLDELVGDSGGRARWSLGIGYGTAALRP